MVYGIPGQNLQKKSHTSLSCYEYISLPRINIENKTSKLESQPEVAVPGIGDGLRITSPPQLEISESVSEGDTQLTGELTNLEPPLRKTETGYNLIRTTWRGLNHI